MTKKIIEIFVAVCISIPLVIFVYFVDFGISNYYPAFTIVAIFLILVRADEKRKTDKKWHTKYTIYIVSLLCLMIFLICTKVYEKRKNAEIIKSIVAEMEDIHIEKGKYPSYKNGDRPKTKIYNGFSECSRCYFHSGESEFVRFHCYCGLTPDETFSLLYNFKTKEIKIN